MTQALRFLVLFLAFALAIPFTGLAQDATITAIQKGAEANASKNTPKDSVVSAKKNHSTEKAYDSFLPLDLKAKFSDRVQELLKLEEAKKNFFFQETKSNTGLSVEEIVASTANTKEGKTFKVVQAMKIESALETAGIKKENNSFEYWRPVHKGETVVMIKNGDTWKPWFLLTCGNPVRVKGPSKEEPKTQPPAPPEVEKKNEPDPVPNPKKGSDPPAPPVAMTKTDDCSDFVTTPSEDTVTQRNIGFGSYHFTKTVTAHGFIHRKRCK